ncbi:MAG: MBL fold metallo-hydrolase [Hyphomicrobiaceae bacterium]
MKRKPFSEFVGVDTTPLHVSATGSKTQGHLLWGDGVKRSGKQSGGRIEVKARGKTGWIAESALGGESLLEVYFIDVGQGDGVLIKTPEFRHIMIDGGNPRERQNTGKNAADFVDWKFVKDYGRKAIELDAIIASHNDLDHYGGLADLLDAAQATQLDAKEVTVERFCHAGLSWWLNGGKRTLGRTAKKGGKSYYTQLLVDRASAESASAPGGGGPTLQGNWGAFIRQAVAAKASDGTPSPFTRLSNKSGHLPGFAPGDGEAVIRVLGPVEETVGGKPALPKFKSNSTTTNGNSILLRLDYGRTRILLTGDLNTESQNLLLEAFAGDRLEFQCDVAKGCHHGSEDVAFSFLQAMKAAVTVISSGDAEGHDHPRPRIVAASGAAGHVTLDKDELITPLVYSTELARSTSFGTPVSLSFKDGQGQDVELTGSRLSSARVEYTERLPGAIRPRKGARRLSGPSIVAGLIYGLVNVRTDGEMILTATLNEGKGTWTVKKFKSRF